MIRNHEAANRHQTSPNTIFDYKGDAGPHAFSQP